MKDQPVFYSAKLNLRYKVDESGVEFEDGVKYSNSEMKKLNDLKDTNLKNIHTIKKTFKGIVQ
jgi:hypothetical protein